MTDIELLELAAKSIGIECYIEDGTLWGSHGALQDEWNPLTDDGDALRLAVKLFFRVEVNQRSAIVYWIQDEAEKSVFEYPQHDQNEDYEIVYSGYEEATRRAIVRAAAYVCEVKK